MTREQAANRSTMQSGVEGLAKAAETQAQGVMAVQQELWHLFEEARQDWLNLAQREAQLASDLSVTLSACKTVPEIAKAYQDWMSESFTMLGEQSQRMFANSQKFMTSATTTMGNGTYSGRSMS
jgi:hypothetical protein